MKKVLFRLIAFGLDLAFVSLIALGLSYIGLFNPNTTAINLKYEDYYIMNSQYKELMSKVDDYFKDGRITDVEFDEIMVEYPTHYTSFIDIVRNEDTDETDIKKVKDKINEIQESETRDLSYQIEKLEFRPTFNTLILYLLYFGVLQYLLGGQTVFKKLFRLRVIDKDNPKKRIGLIKYLIRTIFVAEIILTAISMIMLLTLSQNSYLVANSWLLQVKYIYEMLFLVVLIIRDDNRSIHDLLLNTTVVRFNKDGEIIEEKLFNEIDSNEKVINKTSKNISKKSLK